MPNKSFSLNINHKIKPFVKSIKVDSDKSQSIRSFLIGSISQNISITRNVLESEDVFSTIDCLKKLGIQIKKVKPQKYRIHGKGLGSLFAKKNLELNFGNSGTLARLLIGILSIVRYEGLLMIIPISIIYFLKFKKSKNFVRNFCIYFVILR